MTLAELQYFFKISQKACHGSRRDYVDVMQRIGLMFAGLCFWVGCVDFEKQTMIYRHYPQADTLVIWQQYEGIYGAGGEEALNPTEIEQLQSVVQGQRTFFFHNWIFEYHAAQVTDDLKRLRTELQAKTNTSEQKIVLRKAFELAELAAQNIRVKNGPFCRNAEGKLSATQQVTITNVGKIIAAANHYILANVQQELNSGVLDPDDPGYLPLVEKALDSKLAVIQMQGQNLQVRWPVTQQMYKDEDSQKGIKNFQQLGGRVSFKDNLLTVELGARKGQQAKLSGVIPEKKYADNALAHVKQRYELKEPFDPVAARADFFRRMDSHYKK